MAKQKKPMWPIYTGILVILGTFALLLTDWERYPTAEEMERFCKHQYGESIQIEVSEKIEKDAYVEAKIYEVKMTDANGNVETETFTIQKEKRKAVYPWHDYFEDKYRMNNN